MAGLRERKKQQTRATIVREALRLFRRKGFEATTIADIAEASEIAPRTFFSYFDTKEAVVFHDFDELVERLSAHLAERDPAATTFDALRSWVADWVSTRDFSKQAERVRRDLILGTPALRAHDHGNRAVIAQIVAENVAKDLDLPAESLQPKMVGAAAVSALTALTEMDPGEVPDDPMVFVDEAIAFLQGGLGALRTLEARSRA